MYKVHGINFETEGQANAFVETYEKYPFMMERAIKETELYSFYGGFMAAGVICIGIIFGIVLGKRK